MKGEIGRTEKAGSSHVDTEHRGNALAEQREREKLAFGYMTLRALVQQVQHLQTHEPPRAEAAASAGEDGQDAEPLGSGSVSDAEEVGQAGQTSELRRISVEMQARGLGRVALQVDKSVDGLRVELAIEDGAAAQLALVERKNLQQALQARGVQVASINVSQVAKSGIPFAPSLTNDRVATTREPQRSGRGNQGATAGTQQLSTRLHKRLKLIG